MAQTHDLCTTPALTPPEQLLPARLPALPNAQAALITVGGATPYTLAISWSSTCTLQFVPGLNTFVIPNGWPGLAS